MDVPIPYDAPGIFNATINGTAVGGGRGIPRRFVMPYWAVIMVSAMIAIVFVAVGLEVFVRRRCEKKRLERAPPAIVLTTFS